MSTSTPRAIQPPLLASITYLPVQTMEHRTRDLLHTLNATGITATDAQVHALAELGCRTPNPAPRDLDQAASQHSGIARRVQRAAGQPNLRAIRKETTR